MRVDYTLPALQPAALPETTGAGETLAPAFRDQLRGARLQLPEGLAQVLRLDARPFSASFLGPPPRPKNLEINDAETERGRWQGLVLQHSDAQVQTSEGAATAVARMLNLIQEMQRMEDGLLARCVVGTRY